MLDLFFCCCFYILLTILVYGLIDLVLVLINKDNEITGRLFFIGGVITVVLSIAILIVEFITDCRN